MTANDTSSLHVLGDRGHTVDGSANDVRGREVKDKHGDGIGKVTDLLIDDRENMVRFLLVEHGGFLGFGETKTLIPVEAITKITEHDVCVDQSRERIYAHYGYGPYWGPGYMYPAAGLACLPVMPPLARH
jgi:sporulation protein YlmC with PRC-barrel domain